MVAASELPIETVREGVDAIDMAQTIFGDGVQVVSASYTGDRDSAGIYSNGDSVSPGVTPGDTGMILSTGDVEDFTNSNGSSNQSNSTSTNTSGQNNNSDFNAAAGARTYDASYLDVDFIPDGSVMTMQFVFSSEEYPEFQNSVYQDFVGGWVNGQQVEMDVGDGDTDPGNINTTNNINMFVNNSNDAYNTDVDFVIATSIPCFVAGTVISTDQGDVPVETLQPGDLVLTQDEGLQPLRWIGTRTVAAKKSFAPILIRAGTFGQHNDVRVSPLHRVLVRDSLAELLFGEAEVLVAAKDLVNDRSVIRQAGGTVTYVHLLFDTHQIVFTEGLASESFLPGPQTAKSFEQEIIAEVYSIFPKLDPVTGSGDGSSARRTLRRFEGDLLRRTGAAA